MSCSESSHMLYRSSGEDFLRAGKDACRGSHRDGETASPRRRGHTQGGVPHTHTPPSGTSATVSLTPTIRKVHRPQGPFRTNFSFTEDRSKGQTHRVMFHDHGQPGQGLRACHWSRDLSPVGHGSVSQMSSDLPHTHSHTPKLCLRQTPGQALHVPFPRSSFWLQNTVLPGPTLFPVSYCISGLSS